MHKYYDNIKNHSIGKLGNRQVGSLESEPLKFVSPRTSHYACIYDYLSQSLSLFIITIYRSQYTALAPRCTAE